MRRFYALGMLGATAVAAALASKLLRLVHIVLLSSVLERRSCTCLTAESIFAIMDLRCINVDTV